MSSTQTPRDVQYSNEQIIYVVVGGFRVILSGIVPVSYVQCGLTPLK